MTVEVFILLSDVYLIKRFFLSLKPKEPIYWMNRVNFNSNKKKLSRGIIWTGASFESRKYSEPARRWKLHKSFWASANRGRRRRELYLLSSYRMDYYFYSGYNEHLRVYSKKENMLSTLYSSWKISYHLLLDVDPFFSSNI